MLAVGLLGMTPYDPIAIAFLTVAAVIWLVLGYVLPWQVLLTRDGKPILARTNGTWFVWSIASQSLAVGLAAVHPHLPQLSHLIGILAVLSWSVGTLLYTGIAVLVVLRIVHFGITAQEFEPPYWVAMGALAVSVVAGISIIDMAPHCDGRRSPGVDRRYRRHFLVLRRLAHPGVVGCRTMAPRRASCPVAIFARFVVDGVSAGDVRGRFHDAGTNREHADDRSFRHLVSVACGVGLGTGQCRSDRPPCARFKVSRMTEAPPTFAANPRVEIRRDG